MTTVLVASDDYSSSSLTSSGSSSSSSTSESEDLYTTWIALLATQLQNQDPTDPVDATDFTKQLISLSALEQQALTNETLTSLLSSVGEMQKVAAYDYLGAEITAYGDVAPLSDGTAEWTYNLDKAASEVTLSVLDEDGNVVYSTTGETSSDNHTFTWDGTTDSGGTAEDGAYQLVVEAVDADGEAVDATTYATGTVTSVSTSGGLTVLLMDDVVVPLSYLVLVSEA